MGWHTGSGMGWGMGWGWAFLVLILIGLVLLVVALVRMLGSGRRPSEDERGQARRLLDERYARGEIDSTEYDERRRRLEDG